ncbi:MAG: OmpA family protein [Spirochaeta sp.]
MNRYVGVKIIHPRMKYAGLVRLDKPNQQRRRFAAISENQTEAGVEIHLLEQRGSKNPVSIRLLHSRLITGLKPQPGRNGELEIAAQYDGDRHLSIAVLLEDRTVHTAQLKVDPEPNRRMSRVIPLIIIGSLVIIGSLLLLRTIGSPFSLPTSAPAGAELLDPEARPEADAADAATETGADAADAATETGADAADAATETGADAPAEDAATETGADAPAEDAAAGPAETPEYAAGDAAADPAATEDDGAGPGDAAETRADEQTAAETGAGPGDAAETRADEQTAASDRTATTGTATTESARNDESGTDQSLPLEIDEEYTIYFTPDETYLTEEAHRHLRQIYEILQEIPDADVEMTGHTALFGREAAQNAISRERVENARDYLYSLGWQPEQEPTIDWRGSSEPITRDSSEQHLNRRVIIDIRNGD